MASKPTTSQPMKWLKKSGIQVEGTKKFNVLVGDGYKIKGEGISPKIELYLQDLLWGRISIHLKQEV